MQRHLLIFMLPFSPLRNCKPPGSCQGVGGEVGSVPVPASLSGPPRSCREVLSDRSCLVATFREGGGTALWGEGVQSLFRGPFRVRLSGVGSFPSLRDGNPGPRGDPHGRRRAPYPPTLPPCKFPNKRTCTVTLRNRGTCVWRYTVFPPARNKKPKFPGAQNGLLAPPDLWSITFEWGSNGDLWQVGGGGLCWVKYYWVIPSNLGP